MKLSSLFTAVLILVALSAQAQMKPDMRKEGHTTTRHDLSKIHLNPIRPAVPAAAPQFTTNVTSFHPIPASQLNQETRDAKITFDPVTHQAIAIQGKVSYETIAKAGRSNAVAQCYGYLNVVKAYLKVGAPEEEFAVSKEETDGLGLTHIKMEQRYQGLPVFGGELTLHLNDQGVYLLSGRCQPTPAIDNTTPAVDINTAVNNCMVDATKHTHLVAPESLNASLRGGPISKAELGIYFAEKQTAILAWKVELRPNPGTYITYFVDAQNGKIVRQYDNICRISGDGSSGLNSINSKSGASNYDSALLPPDGPATANANDLFGTSRTINTYQKGSTFYLIDASRAMFNSTQSVFPNDPVGVIWTINAQNTSPENNNFNTVHVTSGNNSWNNANAVSAHYNAGRAFEYFRQTFSRNSINGQGGNIISVINVTEQSGQQMDNAYWNGAAMFYGNGNSAFSSPLAKGLDVGGHEMSHGVIQNTANLEYEGESGAINESFADVFGAMIDRDDWLIGEDVVNHNVYSSGALRDMANPHNGGNSLNDNGWQPAHVSEKYNGSQDNGGVHINSGIPNRAFALFANQVGKNVAEQVYYRALDQYLTRSSQFVDLRIAVIQAATDLHGANSTQVTAAANAFSTVGIGAGQGGDYEDDVDTNPGDEYILYTNNDKSQLFIVTPGGQSIANPLTNVGPLSKPSITDDGSAIVYIAEDQTMQGVLIDWQTGNAQQIVIDDNPIWRNVAISKDGNRIAALTDDYDNYVFVYDFITNTSQEYELYNPTYAQGVETGDVAYPDVLEWDLSGEYVMYDALNEISNISGNIEYWDIGFVRVWDSGFNNFGDGYISKLFSGLPENTSVGNPSFSKNSPYIIAMDYLDEYNEEYYLLGANIEADDAEFIFNNIDLSYPNYSVDDTHIIFDAFNNQNARVIGVTQVGQDKITPVGDPAILISGFTGARWGTWFADGSRVLVGTHEAAQNDQLKVYPNPFSDAVNIILPENLNGTANVSVMDAVGRTVVQKETTFESGRSSNGFSLSTLPAGAYFLRVQMAGQLFNTQIIKK